MVGVGKGEWIFIMDVDILENAFPKMRREGYQITSEETPDYNCFAWGLGDKTKWISPIRANGYHWPDGVPQDLELSSFVTLYQREGGFAVCETNEFEAGFEKIAIYCNNKKEVTHVARQLQSGAWTSKLGDWEDISHKSLAAITGDWYGEVAQLMKRRV